VHLQPRDGDAAAAEPPAFLPGLLHRQRVPTGRLAGAWRGGRCRWRLGQLLDDDGGLDADGGDDVLSPAQLDAEQQSGGKATWAGRGRRVGAAGPPSS